ncbi:Alpha/Beta hydrolase protein [Microdochium trichocladiopsis]|uniref:Alpha/Beta hydrolase protein n=1 Tax=Microdochium trichocladiopsis TaxID=1682393 RepID=A0A9P8Y1T7_9PEZI|nr:Alpha/Beta hydrolase protein [Microdochium trichocladiopsis]KAH7025267.1 Alpha/Beta hydrolase protein [Microdochium trichocladiopsis]
MQPGSISPVEQLVAGTNPAALPLVLIHDGGGTVDSYRSLGPFECDIYAISDPRFEDEQPWQGGMREMAQAYLDLIKEKVPSKEILLGGWSFGGLLSVELACMLDGDDSLKVAGLILIDTPYASIGDRTLHDVMYSDMPDLPGMPPRLRRRIYSSIQRARQMMFHWQEPSAYQSSGGISDSDSDEGSPIPSQLIRRRAKLPPAVLLRASEFVKPGAGAVQQQQQPVSVVDSFRRDPTLGWDRYQESFIDLVWNVPGSHYSLFESRNVRHLNERLSSAYNYLWNTKVVG